MTSPAVDRGRLAVERLRRADEVLDLLGEATGILPELFDGSAERRSVRRLQVVRDAVERCRLRTRPGMKGPVR